MRCKDVRLCHSYLGEPTKKTPAVTWKTKFWPTWAVCKQEDYWTCYRGIHIPTGLAWARDFQGKEATIWRTELMFTLIGKDNRQKWHDLNWDWGAKKCEAQCTALTQEPWTRLCAEIARDNKKGRELPCPIPDWALDLNADEMILIVDYLIEIGRNELAMDIRRHWLLEFGPV